jgi:hypothetical protein
VARPGVGSGVHFLPVLLVLENDGDILGVVQQFWVAVQKYSTGRGSKNKATHADTFGSAQRERLGVFARSHRKEESTEY